MQVSGASMPHSLKEYERKTIKLIKFYCMYYITWLMVGSVQLTVYLSVSLNAKSVKETTLLQYNYL